MKHALIFTLIAAVTLPVAAPALAAPQAGQTGSQVILSWDEFVKITGFDPTRTGPQVLTIPWSEVQAILGDNVKLPAVSGQTKVDLPWQDFKELLEWSVRRKADTGEDVPPPTDFVVTACEFAGKISDEQATFVMTLGLEVLRKAGWKSIPLLPATVAITKAKLPEGAYLNAANGRYYDLLLGEGAGAKEITLEFVARVESSGGVNRVRIGRMLPSAAVMDLTFDRKDVDVTVGGAQSQVVKVEGDTTHVAAAIAGTTEVDISWQRALPKVKAAPSKLYAETRTLVAVGEGLLICEERVHVNILHSAIRKLDLSVPKGVSVLTVTGSGIQDWRVENGELSIVLRQDTIGSVTLQIQYETTGTDAVSVPVIRPRGVERDRGYVAVVALGNVEITGDKSEGARKVDVRRLPGDMIAMTAQPILLAYRYVGDALSIPLTIKRHGELPLLVTVVDSALFTSMQLNDGRRVTKVNYAVRNNRNQFLRLTLPAGAEMWSASVGGNPVTAATDATGKILIPLIRSTGTGAELRAFPVELVYVETPDTPAPTSGSLKVALPVVHVPTMHVMVNYYLPDEGRYGKSGGGMFGGKATSAFSGPLRQVDQFASLSTTDAGLVEKADRAAGNVQLQQMANQRADSTARAAGVTPIRVTLPLHGKRFRLEKILALPGDALWFKVTYSGWKPAE